MGNKEIIDLASRVVVEQLTLAKEIGDNVTIFNEKFWRGVFSCYIDNDLELKEDMQTIIKEAKNKPPKTSRPKPPPPPFK